MQKIHTSDEEIKAMQDYLDNLLDKKRPDKRVWKERLRTITYALLILFLLNILYSVFSARSRGETPDIFGYQFYQIESGSMEPTLVIGDIILSKKYDTSQDLAINDIITFKTIEGMTVTHRIVEVTTDDAGQLVYKTKGDNENNAVDMELVIPDRIEAVMVLRLPLK